MGLSATLMGGVGLWLVLSDDIPAPQPAMILCTIFIVLGQFVLFFITKRLAYELDKTLNHVTLLYPAHFATKYKVVTFCIGKLNGIIKKIVLQSSDSGSNGYINRIEERKPGCK